MKIYLASDHAGYNLKNNLLKFLIDKGFEVIDCGPYEYNEDDDYPDYVASLASEVSQNPNENFGIIVGGSGQGEAIMANRYPNVRAVVFQGNGPTPEEGLARDRIVLTRSHNNANVLSMGSWFVTEDAAKEAIIKWLSTPFSSEERHLRRLRKVEALSHGSGPGTRSEPVEL